MSPPIQALLIVQAFRTICVLSGCLLGYLGYRLFRLGVYEKQGELKAQWGGKSLLLRQVGPGVFFALFGVAIAATGCLRKFDAEFTGSTVSSGAPIIPTVRQELLPIKPLETPQTEQVIINEARQIHKTEKAQSEKAYSVDESIPKTPVTSSAQLPK